LCCGFITALPLQHDGLIEGEAYLRHSPCDRLCDMPSADAGAACNIARDSSRDSNSLRKMSELSTILPCIYETLFEFFRPMEKITSEKKKKNTEEKREREREREERKREKRGREEEREERAKREREREKEREKEREREREREREIAGIKTPQGITSLIGVSF